MKVPIFLALILFIGCKASSDISGASDNASAILFTVNGEPVLADEFVYIYKKNSISNDSAFTRKAIDEYLDLYINFKLKVAEAIHRGMDTTAAFRREFNTYKEQLKKPYLTENKVTEKLMTEAYNRYKQEINAAHILIRLDPDASPEDTLRVYKKLLDIREQAMNGADFSVLAERYSADPSARKNGGNLGYFTSFQMVYPFESAAYNTAEGEISLPVRTKFGYHIIKVLDKRPSQGSVKVSHIMIRIKPDKMDSLRARNKIFEIYDQAVGGVNWNSLVNQFSDDMNTKHTGGILKAFRVGQMPYAFQEAAYSLEQPGDISDPVMTPFGWHIIKLEQKLPLESFKEMEAVIKSRISRDSRAKLNKKALIERLKKENGFKETKQKLYMIDVVDSLLDDNGSFSEDETLLARVLFTLADEEYTVGNFVSYLKEHVPSKTPFSKVNLRDQYNKFAQDRIIAYEENHLKDKYIDYRMLVKEYREGILLFELMEEEIWNKAVKDTAGLNAFFYSNTEDYQWQERVKAVVYNSDQPEVIADIDQLIAVNDTVALSKNLLEKQYNDKTALTLQIDQGIFEPGDDDIVDLVEWTVGSHKVSKNGRHNLVWIRDVLAPGPKALNEVKGLVISDYQNYLEALWVKKLKNKYPVKINRSGLNSIYEVLEK